MTLLADLPWFRVLDGDDGAIPIGHAQAGQPVDVACDPAALVRAAAGVAASHAVIVLPDIQPLPVAPALSPDPALLASGRALLWPAINDLTGEVTAARGLWVIPAALVARQAAAMIGSGSLSADMPKITVPQVAVTWTCGRSAETAFRAGFGGVDPGDPARAALSASLGADRPNGDWWGIGACLGLLGGSADRAWDEEQASRDGEPLQRWLELARRVRVDTGLAVRPLDAAAAAALRAMRGGVVPTDIWDRFLHDIADIGPSVARLHDASLLASATLWGRTEADTAVRAPQSAP